MPKSDVYYIAVLGKALDILDVFAQAERSSLRLQEITELSRLNKNVVFRVLYTLAEHGYVVKRDSEYELGHKLLRLSNIRLRRKDLVAVVGPCLDRLREQFGETVNLGVLDAGQIRYVDVRESHHSFRLAERVGGSDLLHCTALGKAFLAFLPFDEARRLLAQHGMPRRTNRSMTTITAMKAELDWVRKHGYAVDRAESMEGALCVAVPILDGQGTPVAAVSIAGPVVRFKESTVPVAAETLLMMASEIREQMDYSIEGEGKG